MPTLYRNVHSLYLKSVLQTSRPVICQIVMWLSNDWFHPCFIYWELRFSRHTCFMSSCSFSSRLLRSPITWPAKRRSWLPSGRPTVRERPLWQPTNRRNSTRRWTSANRTPRRWEHQLLQIQQACYGIIIMQMLFSTIKPKANQLRGYFEM